MNKAVEQMYKRISENIEKLTPDPMEDFFMTGSDHISVIVQIRCLKTDFLQARITSLRTEQVNYIEGSAQDILHQLKYNIEVAAGLIDETHLS